MIKTNKFPISSVIKTTQHKKLNIHGVAWYFTGKERIERTNTRKSSTNKQSRDPLFFFSSNVNAHSLTGESHDKILITVHARALAKVRENSGTSFARPWLLRGRHVTGSRTRIQDQDGTEIRSTAAWSRVQACECDESSPSFLSSRVDAQLSPHLPLPLHLSPPSRKRNNITDVATTVVKAIPGKDRGIENLFSVVEFNYERCTKLVAVH